MAKIGYFVDEETIERLNETLAALRCFTVFANETESDIPLNEIKAVLNILDEYGNKSSDLTKHGLRVYKEGCCLQKIA